MTKAMWPAVAQTFRRAGPPLAWYYAVTLALPLANGAAQAVTAFVEHALVVLVLPPILIVLACAAREIVRTLGRGCSRTFDASANAASVVTWPSHFCTRRRPKSCLFRTKN